MWFNPLDTPLCFELPRRLTNVYFWHQHIPFAFALVQALKPTSIVELGTHQGDSYCAFCQAVATLGIPTRAVAVDAWEGDSHVGSYGPEVLAELAAYHDPLYGSFSRLCQMRFDQAVALFDDGSIDLLHIDGLHSYEAVAHDLATWRPKLAPTGIVLLHDITPDTQLERRGYGVQKLWGELVAAGHPSFAFTHGYGLGVVALGAVPDALAGLFTAGNHEQALIACCFAALGHRVSLLSPQSETVAKLKEELAGASSHSESLSRELAWKVDEVAALSAEALRDRQQFDHLQAYALSLEQERTSTQCHARNLEEERQRTLAYVASLKEALDATNATLASPSGSGKAFFRAGLSYLRGLLPGGDARLTADERQLSRRRHDQ